MIPSEYQYRKENGKIQGGIFGEDSEEDRERGLHIQVIDTKRCCSGSLNLKLREHQWNN